MTIEQQTFVREILMVRSDVDAPWAFHQKKITRITGAPFAIPEQYGEAEPLTGGELPNVVDAVLIDLTEERNAAVSARIASDAALIEMTAAREEAVAANAGLIVERDAAQALASARETELQAMTNAHNEAAEQLAAKVAEVEEQAGQIAALQAQIAELTPPAEE